MKRRPSRRCFFGSLAALGAPLSESFLSPASAADTYTMRMYVPTAATSLLGLAALQFATAVDRRSKGQLKIDVYPNGQLAQQQEAVDAISSGVIDFAILSTSFLVQLFPKYQVFDIPFLFKNIASAYRVLDGPMGEEFFADLGSKNIAGLGWGIAGFQELETTSKPVVVPEDVKGLRIRIRPSAVQAAMYQSLGANPVTIDFSETLMAFRSHTVDGFDSNLDSVITGKFYTVTKQVAMLNHVPALQTLLGSKSKIDALPPSLQTIIKEEGRALVPFWQSSDAKQTAESVQFLKQNGVAFTQIQYSPFRKAVEPVFVLVQSKLGGNLLERLTRAANAA